MRLVIAALSLASVMATAAFAQSDTPAPAPTVAQAQTQAADPTTTAAKLDDEKMICMDQDSGGNSRLGNRKVCRTQKQWDAMARVRR